MNGEEKGWPIPVPLYFAVVYALLVLFVVWSGLRLMATLRTSFFSIYRKARCRIVMICAVGVATLSVRLALSIVY